MIDLGLALLCCYYDFGEVIKYNIKCILKLSQWCGMHQQCPEATPNVKSALYKTAAAAGFSYSVLCILMKLWLN